MPEEKASSAMSVLETYLRDLSSNRPFGVKETSHYGILQQLFNHIGSELKPKVRCIIHPQSQGAGLPDGGFYSQDQFPKLNIPNPIAVMPPSRGVLEVKGTAEEVHTIAKDKQVLKYLGKYRQVLVTNYRDFLLVVLDEDGRPQELEGYKLAQDEKTFWHQAASPHTLAAEHEARFTEYLKRVMLQSASLAAPRDVAWFLASYARDAKDRVERAELPTLDTVRTALEEALGLKFQGQKGEHFFRSTLVQTLFYGIFSAWVLWHKERPNRKDHFDWRTAEWRLQVPIIRAIFEQVATPRKLTSLDLVEVLDWTGNALNRVDRQAFFVRFEEAMAVQYFYEPFLQAFDPELRKQLGVWYTPPEIVKYMVERVDRVLREELDIEDGLADPSVYVLDPCTGTGSYLVEVLRKIDETLKSKGEDALGGVDLKRAAMERIFGFEILPAPFVVAHLQLGLLLQNHGASLSEKKGERVGVYLTKALTGWEPAEGPKQRLLFPELEEERDAAEEVKREKPILVILGNPPYNAFAGVSPKEEKGLVDPYKEGLNKPVSQGGWGIMKFNLDDLYVRFFRLAERRVAEMTGKGVVCYISNHSWISDPSFVVLRQHLLESFDSFWIENMHGNRRISEYAPDGRTSETIFAVPGFSSGIQQGVAISMWVKNGRSLEGPKVLYRNDIDAARAVERRARLLETLKEEDRDARYEVASPSKSNRFACRPFEVSPDYLTWPRVADLAAREPYNGPIERRGNSLVVMAGDGEALTLLETYLDPTKSDEEVKLLAPKFMRSSGEFVADRTRNLLKGKVIYDPSNIVKYPFKPFDVRLAYLSADIQPLFSRPK